MGTVVVSVLTRNRPADLDRLLQVLAVIDLPRGWDISFLIVDNDPEGSAEPIVARARAKFGPRSITHLVEAAPGIPAARNRALDEAAARGATLLAFIDDDETPAPDWLVEIVRHFERTRCQLIGGPNLIAPAVTSLSRWQEFLVGSIQARNKLMARNIFRLHRQGKFIVVSSGNWLADVAWLWKHEIRFSDALRSSGGSDVAISLEIARNGGTMSWCPTAVIYEHLPPERISVRWQFSRHRQQAMVMAGLRPVPPARLIPTQLGRLTFGAAVMCVPTKWTFMAGLYFVGSSVGKLQSLLGATSRVYD